MGNGGLDLSTYAHLPQSLRGQRVLILITLATSFPRIGDLWVDTSS